MMTRMFQIIFISGLLLVSSIHDGLAAESKAKDGPIDREKPTEKRKLILRLSFPEDEEASISIPSQLAVPKDSYEEPLKKSTSKPNSPPSQSSLASPPDHSQHFSPHAWQVPFSPPLESQPTDKPDT